MIYLDTSVARAWLLGEGRHPPAALWECTLASSRRIEYELWNRLRARGLGTPCADAANALLGRLVLIELAGPVLTRALDPFPVPVRTVHTTHLATALHLHNHSQRLQVATYDNRLGSAALAVGLTLADDIG